jgi:hypothetical protein
MADQRVAVVVPLYRDRLTPSEELSLRSLRRHLSQHPLILVVPEGSAASLPGFTTQTFPERYFRARHKYSQLLVSTAFYQQFQRYEYLLIYQLDCLVFGDELEAWCARGFDYVGAPWVRAAQGGYEFAGVGNGGFSLRRVAACLSALQQRDRDRTFWSQKREIVGRYLQRFAAYVKRGVQILRARDLDRLVTRSRTALEEAKRHAVPDYLNEDLFWASVPERFPPFVIPDAQTAVAFAFEVAPRFCYEQNDRRLPFGCHQWEVYDPDFWQPHLTSAVDG